MADDPNRAILERIASALERIAPPPASAPDWLGCPAYVWQPSGVDHIASLNAAPLDQLIGIGDQKARLLTNFKRHSQSLPSHDALLWGARGMGKSALVLSVTKALQDQGHDLGLVQLAGGADALSSLPGLLATLATVDRRFVVFIDDIGFEGREGLDAARVLRSLLEGGAKARPENVRIAVTSNRRAIVERHMAEQDDPVNPRDALDDRLALADRFGLSIGFHACDQDQYLCIVRSYAETHGLIFDETDALLWAQQRGARSGRVARHYIVELAGRLGKALPRAS